MVVRRNYRKWLWWGAGVLVVALAVTTIIVLVINNNAEKEIVNNEQNQTQTMPSNEKKEEKEEEKEPEVKKEEVKQYDGDSPNMADSLTGVISYAGVSGGDLIIRVNIDQYLTTGNCGLTLKRDGNIIYSVTTNIEGSVSTSTCNGFKISSGELSSGKLEIEIALESGDKRGKILGEATI